MGQLHSIYGLHIGITYVIEIIGYSTFLRYIYSALKGGFIMKLRAGEKGDLIRDIQNSLVMLGYNPGPANGIFSENTKKAIARLQKDKHFEDDGMVGPNTLKTLGIKAGLHIPKPARKTRRGLISKSKGNTYRR